MTGPTDTPEPTTVSSRPPSGMARRFVVTLSCLALMGLMFGFTMFATHALRAPPPTVTPADGIIVLTGGDRRIVEGAGLLRSGIARRLLISGVNPRTGRDDVIRLSGLDAAKFSCCVDLGYAAQDTIGNAEEARTWADGIGARRIIVVTSGYHMLRSLTELAIAMPGVVLVPHPVVPRALRARPWWLQPGLTRLLATEYAKFLPVAARYAVVRHVAPLVPGHGSTDRTTAAAAP
jgi:uncharacterized SAM-binding protein YcdF (DUF218 family)